MEKREIEITNLIPIKSYESYKLNLEWRNYKLYLVATVGNLTELQEEEKT